MQLWQRIAALAAMTTGAPLRIRTPWREFWRRFCQQPVAAVVFVVLLIIAALLAHWMVPFEAENYFDYGRLNEEPTPFTD